MATIMYASCKVGITCNSRHTDYSKWQLCHLVNSWFSVKKAEILTQIHIHLLYPKR